MLIWTDAFPRRSRPLGAFRLARARLRFFGGIFPIRQATPSYRGKLEALRDSRANENCFLIGNGPSLRDFDFSAINRAVSIGSNGLYRLFEEKSFQTDYLLFEDTEQTEIRGPELHKIKGPTKIVALNSAYCVKSPDEHTIFMNVRRADSHYWNNLGIQFSKDFANIVYLGSTISYIGLQLAYHLGCSTVFLIGFDHDYGPISRLYPPGKIEINETNQDLVSQAHFAEDYYRPGHKIGVPYVGLQERAFDLARKVFELEDRKIYNVTPKSKLTVFPQITTDEMFKIMNHGR